MTRPDFRDYEGGTFVVEHSAKGSTWKKGHKYIKKVNGKYYYKKDDKNKSKAKTPMVTANELHWQTNEHGVPEDHSKIRSATWKILRESRDKAKQKKVLDAYKGAGKELSNKVKKTSRDNNKNPVEKVQTNRRKKKKINDTVNSVKKTVKENVGKKTKERSVWR